MIIPLHIILWITGVVSLIVAIAPQSPIARAPANEVLLLFYSLLDRTGYLTVSMICFGSLAIACGLDKIDGYLEGKLDAIRNEIRMASKPTESPESFFKRDK